MTDLAAEIERALASGEPIARAKVVEWIGSTSDLPTLAKLYRLTDEAYQRIKPELGGEPTCELIQRYLLECIRQDAAETDGIQGRWEAARTLHAWYCHLATMDADNSAILRKASHAITEAFLTGGEDVRNAIEQGFLEHALEMDALRPYFDHWSAHPALREPWERALEWGKAHPNYTWELLQQFKKMQDQESE